MEDSSGPDLPRLLTLWQFPDQGAGLAQLRPPRAEAGPGPGGGLWIGLGACLGSIPGTGPGPESLVSGDDSEESSAAVAEEARLLLESGVVKLIDVHGVDLVPMDCVSCRMVSRTVRAPVLTEFIRLTKGKSVVAAPVISLCLVHKQNNMVRACNAALSMLIAQT